MKGIKQMSESEILDKIYTLVRKCANIAMEDDFIFYDDVIQDTVISVFEKITNNSGLEHYSEEYICREYILPMINKKIDEYTEKSADIDISDGIYDMNLSDAIALKELIKIIDDELFSKTVIKTNIRMNRKIPSDITYGDLITMRYIDGMTYDEISHFCGDITTENVRQKIFKARRELIRFIYRNHIVKDLQEIYLSME